MRDILFRGKKYDNWKWVYGGIVQQRDGTVEIWDYSDVLSACRYLGGLWHRVDKNTVGQYTGFNDRNGSKIFEGDIISFVDDYLCGTDENRGAVIFENGQFDFTNAKSATWEDLKMEDGNYDCRIIGNIYDNPELLDEQ